MRVRVKSRTGWSEWVPASKVVYVIRGGVHCPQLPVGRLQVGDVITKRQGKRDERSVQQQMADGEIPEMIPVLQVAKADTPAAQPGEGR